MTPRTTEGLAQLRREQPITDAQLARHVDPSTLLVLRDAITATPRIEPDTARRTDPDTAKASQRRRLPRRLLAPAVAVALAAGGAAAYASLASHHDTQSIACVLPDNTSGIPQVTGDPVADCVAFWRRNGVNPPEGVAAYETGHGIVVAAPDQAPRGASRLPAGVAQDPALIELAASLQDPVDGLYSTCRDAAAASTFVNSELQRLHITGWTITVDPARPPRGDACAIALPDDATRTITLAGMTDVIAPAHTPIGHFAELLRHDITDTCVSLDQAGRVVHAAARESGLGQDAVTIDALDDRSASCTRIDVVAVGQLAVTLHGPAGK